MALILARLIRWVSPALVDDDAAESLFHDCRTLAPGCTATDVCAAIDAKGPQAKETQKPIGFLLTVVPKLFAGDGLSRIREQEQAERKQKERASAVERERKAALVEEMAMESRVDAAWDAMGEAERSERLACAEKQLKIEKRWQPLTLDVRQREVEASARRQLRRELEGQATKAAGGS